MSRNLSLFIITYIDRDVTHYELGEGRCCISIGEDLRRSVAGASSSELGPLGRGRAQSGKDPSEVKVLEW